MSEPRRQRGVFPGPCAPRLSPGPQAGQLLLPSSSASTPGAPSAVWGEDRGLGGRPRHSDYTSPGRARARGGFRGRRLCSAFLRASPVTVHRPVAHAGTRLGGRPPPQGPAGAHVQRAGLFAEVALGAVRTCRGCAFRPGVAHCPPARGSLILGSPRDPRPAETLQAFAEAADWAQAGRFSQQDVDEAKLAVFSVVDAPVAPSDKGMGGEDGLGAALLGPVTSPAGDTPTSTPAESWCLPHGGGRIPRPEPACAP